jgi:dTDP-4-dehydrorhamnose reductase
LTLDTIPTPERVRPELWGGIECTVNRVGGRFFDQLHLTGHHERDGDLDRIAALGLRVVRFPVLWERVEQQPGEFDWTWTDRRLAHMRTLGLDPIVTLVHHGSGPAWTSLIDPGFASGLAHYARLVAERYPWVRRYTVVNEPLTTARFSALYGVWYPHASDDRLFVKALLNECRATVLAKAAIREVTPEARFVQTEDICRVDARPALAERAAFYNERRWLSLDLLCGRVRPDHTLWSYLRRSGASHADVQFFLTHDGSPDVIGMNYYLTSDRLLDDRVDRYPDRAPDRPHPPEPPFVDVEAARSHDGGIAGHRHHLEAIWARYGLPTAITEVHTAGPREQQLRWLRDAWQASHQVAAQGIPVEGVTVWSLFGSFDWDRLVIEARGYYENGAFDVRAGGCRPTAIAQAIRELASGDEMRSVAVAGRGWWDRAPAVFTTRGTPVLITGARGTLGSALLRACRARGLACHGSTRAELDIADPESVRRVFQDVRPWAVINAAGYVRVDEAEADEARCRRENVDGAAHLAAAAGERGVTLLTYSSDLVFNGDAGRPYVESDATAPLNAYGRSKADAERAVLQSGADVLVVRTAAFFGPWDDHNLVTRALAALCRGERFMLPVDAVVSATYVPDLADASLDLLIDGEVGVWHLANHGPVSWFELARMAAERVGLPTELLQPCAVTDLHLPVRRPLFSALASERGDVMPTLEAALDRFAAQVETLPSRTLREAG